MFTKILVCAAAIVAASASVSALSTNECFMILAGAPENICSLNAQGCLCNEAFMMIVGQSAVPSLAGMCGWTTPYTCLPPTYNYGGGQCKDSDAALDAKRFGSILQYFGYLGPLYSAPYEQSCFNRDYCVGNMSLIMDKEVVMNFPYGLGVYKGFQHVCDYLGIPTAGINRGLLQLVNTPTAGDYAVFFPNMIVMGANGNNAQSLGLTMNNLFFEYSFGFNGCASKMQSIALNTNSVLFGVETNAWRTSASFYLAQKAGVNQYSIQDICTTHQTYCTGQDKQYASFQACVDYLSALPLKTAECGTAKFMFGNALPCKYKHSTMVPINKLHCAHIGPLGTVDREGNQKCYAGECANLVNSMPFPWERLDSIDGSAYAAAKNTEAYQAPKACKA